ncbi:hypothetical protein [Gracilibacillus sp. JCM 18860]
MEKAHESIPVTESKPPENIIEVPIDLNTGLLATDECGEAYTMPFIKGTQPSQYCTSHLEEINEENSEELKEITEDDPFLEDWWDWLWFGDNSTVTE